jgi:hypothetical protein
MWSAYGYALWRQKNKGDQTFHDIRFGPFKGMNQQLKDEKNRCL